MDFKVVFWGQKNRIKDIGNKATLFMFLLNYTPDHRVQLFNYLLHYNLIYVIQFIDK